MIVGIDLGTTNSLVAWLTPNGPELIPNSLGEYLTPSAVGIDRDGQLLVGRAAKELQVVAPERCATVFKRLMGTDRKVSVADKTFRAEELSSLVLKSLKADAEKHIGQEVTEAVITVPAYFSDLQRKATIHAGQLAGFNVRRIINEPTAAAIAYGLHELQKERVALVFDLGGGTFDVSILDQFESTLEIKASAGEIFLGGEDFTRTLASQILAAKGMNFEHTETRHPQLVSRLIHECEKAKRRLTTGEDASVKFPDTDGLVSESSESVTVSRTDFLRWTESLLAKTRLPLQRAMSDAGLTRAQIEDVILVGGATRMPQIAAMLKEIFGREPLCQLDPDHVVALGAAIQGGLVHLDSAVTEMVVTDICPFTLGVEVSKDIAGTNRGGYFSPLISRNTTIPVSRMETFCTTTANQSTVKIRVFQGEGRRIDDNLFLAEFELKGIPRGPAGQVITIRFTYDLNGVLEVEAAADGSGSKASCVITHHAQNLSPEELKRAIEKLQELKVDPAEDQVNRHVLKWADRVYRELSGDARRMLEMLITGFEEALALQDPSAIENHRTTLEQFLESVDPSIE
ncbi:MAG: Hsp70 family protein [Planctomycetaceae bacterium]|nr:Hsp70 family protein [Planctomycetaceae bacterium]